MEHNVPVGFLFSGKVYNRPNGVSYSAAKEIAVPVSSAAIKLTGLTDNGNFVSLGYDGSPLWATGNLDKTNNCIVSPLEAGEYFMYGYTTPYILNSPEYTGEYTGTESPLSSDHDAAYQANNAWRIPTKEQFGALISNTSFKWKGGWTTIGTLGGGVFLTSKANGISLFFAAAGSLGDQPYFSGWAGFYSTSTPSDESVDYDTVYAYSFAATGSGLSESEPRDLARPVRPVQN